ncbi:NADAR family protein [Parerythrobacter aestuarii]|uniref:NADAR family protein n=1 Tax=Parerythrobacter aestuarii TaxID=3020909 RepID=UPI0024DEB5F4|nr:NADAR family protein [Parerythrobacter aestuarii]
MIAFPASPAIAEPDLPAAHEFGSFHPFLKGVFSQWHPTPFEVEGVAYNCAEQYMMAAKASLFGAEAIYSQIMGSDDPALHKRLGAQVKSFDSATWSRWRYHIVHTASIAKFSQNAGARRRLRNTAPSMLVEANPRDWVWGNGLAADDPATHDPNQWRGTNFLGRILTLVRDNLSEEEML